MSESFETGDGRTLAYERRGSGPLLVCHPGGPGFSSRYFADLAGLAADFELLLLNPRGTDGSDRPPDARAYRTEDYVADLEELRAQLGIERMHLLGHSHGGVVAQLYASTHPNRVDRLVLASTLARFAAEQEQAMVAGMERHADEPWYAEGREALEREQAGEYDSDEELGELAFRELPFYFARYGDDERRYLDSFRDEVPNGDALRLFNAEIFTTFDLRPSLGLIDAPTLVITGAEDFITGPICAAELAQAIGDAETVVLPDAGHFVFVEEPDRFREEVRRFLMQ